MAYTSVANSWEEKKDKTFVYNESASSQGFECSTSIDCSSSSSDILTEDPLLSRNNVNFTEFVPVNFEQHLPDLRKQARILENEIDMKLITFSKLGMGETGSSYKSLSEVNIPQPKGHGFETVAAEVQQLLEKLAELNHNMEEMASSEVHSSSAVLHTLQRHREILQDYKQEFHKMQANYQARREREDLLKSVRKDIDNYKNSAGLNRRLDIYLKENEHIRSSDRLVDEQISIALDTRDHLMSQRLSLKRFQTKLNDISNRFPIVNSLIQRINVRKHRDSIILGLVIGICTVLLIIYASG